jgi:hypothetical protein
MSARSEFQLADRRITEWFLRERAAREGEATVHHHHLPIAITISRQCGAGGHMVGEALERKLGKPWLVWDRAIIEEVASRANVHSEMIRSLDERSRTWVEDVIRFSMGLGIVEQAAFRKHLALVLASLAQQGHVITIGRGANFILPAALNVRLMADIETRAQTTMRLRDLGHADAIKYIQQIDKGRAEYTKTYFNRDINDPFAYSMVLCTSDLGIPATVDAIIAAARARFGTEVADVGR